jgi:hypothetical protein
MNKGLFWEIDSGHGWLKVDLADLYRSGAQHSISSCSYVDAQKGVAYLEEDCDAGKYLQAIGWTTEDSKEPSQENYTDGDSFVRNLPQWDFK